jgi:hypothetical protein
MLEQILAMQGKRMSEQIPTDLLSRALNYPDDQLFGLIGKEESVRKGVRTDDVRKLIRQGKEWWSKKEAELRPLICGNAAVQRLSEGATLDIAQAIYVAILSEVKVELRIYACALVIKAGISTWCQPIWHKP